MKSIFTIGITIVFVSFYLFGLQPDLEIYPPGDKGDPVSKNALVLKGDVNKVILQTSNGCGIGNFLIPSTGDPILGIPPVLGSFDGFDPNHSYKILDTIPGSKILGVAFDRGWWGNNTSIISETSSLHPYIVVSDTGMFSYQYSSKFSPLYDNEILRINAVYKPGIIKMARQITILQTNPIVLLIDDPVDEYQIHFYSYPDLQELFYFPFQFEPEIFEVVEDDLFITGLDTNGSYTLYHYSTLQDTLFAKYILNDTASNAQQLLRHGDSLFLLSSPGDSVTILTTLNIQDSSLIQKTIYSQSGARATYNEYKNGKLFTFQPTSDLPASYLDKQILILDPVTAHLDTFQINLRVDQFKHPVPASNGFGYFSLGWIAAKWGNSQSDSIFIADEFYANIYQLQTGAMPKYINATFGCWIGIPENEMDKIKFKAYPNPASSEVVISLSGLEKGKQYKLYITDISGKIYYSTNLEAYQELNFPIHKYASGVYFLNLDTGRNLITRKLIIQ